MALENILRRATQMQDLQSAYKEIISCFTFTREKAKERFGQSHLRHTFIALRLFQQGLSGLLSSKSIFSQKQVFGCLIFRSELQQLVD